MAATTNLGKLTIKGRTFDHWLNQNGKFCAKLNDEVLSHETLKGLRDSLGRRLAAKPLNIPFVEWEDNRDEGHRVRRGVVISRHTGNDNVIVKYEGESQSQQVRRWGTKLLKHDTDVKRLEQLHAAVVAARAAYEVYLDEQELSVPLNIEG